MKSLTQQIQESILLESKIDRSLKNDIIAEIDNVSPIAQEIVAQLKAYNGEKSEAFAAKYIEPILNQVAAAHKGSFTMKMNNRTQWAGWIALPGDKWVIKGSEEPGIIYVNLTGRYGDEHPWITLSGDKYEISNITDASFRTY